MKTIEELLSQIKQLRQQHNAGTDVSGQLDSALAELEQLKTTRGGSRFVGQGADRETVAAIAAGGSVQGGQLIPGDGGDLRAVQPVDVRTANEFLNTLWSARKGDASAWQTMASKGWVETTGGDQTGGGFLVGPDILPGYIEQRRATSPLRDRLATYVVDKDEVWITTETGAVTVQHVAEAATKPDSTGSVGQKVSTVFKVAGTSHVSTELLRDSAGNVGDLVGKQFGQQIGIAIDTAIISGSGTGQPTGIRNAAGVNSQAVDGQTGQLLYNSIRKAQNRIAGRFYTADTIAMHPRDAVKFDLAVDDNGQYLFPGGASGALAPVPVVLDANLPSSLGAGTNQTVVIVGDFRSGGVYLQRQPLTIDVSEHAGDSWFTNQVVFRGEERYGFVVVVPGAFEVLTGITP